MPYARTTRKSYKRPYNRYRTAAKKTKKYAKYRVSNNVRSYVKRAIHANVENKRVSYSLGFPVGNFQNSNVLQVKALTPGAGAAITLLQGTGQGDRIGNKVRIMKAMLRYTASVTAYDVILNPIPQPMEFMIIFGYVKATPTIAPNAAQVALLFQNGNTALSPAGDISDLIQPYNTDFWCIKKTLRHKIGNSVNEGTGSAASRAYYANNDYKINVVNSINITNIYPKLLNFSDNSTGAQNAALFMMVQAVNANGTLSGAAAQPVLFEYCIDITYEDA